MAEQSPAAVRLIVYRGRNVVVPGRPHSCVHVVMRLGDVNFGTDPADQPSPRWNQECDLAVKQHNSLFGILHPRADCVEVVVKDEKKHSLGRVKIPIDRIPAERLGKQWMPILDDAKEECGQLLLDVWVCKWRTGAGRPSPHLPRRSRQLEIPAGMIQSRSVCRGTMLHCFACCLTRNTVCRCQLLTTRKIPLVHQPCSTAQQPRPGARRSCFALPPDSPKKVRSWLFLLPAVFTFLPLFPWRLTRACAVIACRRSAEIKRSTREPESHPRVGDTPAASLRPKVRRRSRIRGKAMSGVAPDPCPTPHRLRFRACHRVSGHLTEGPW